jgi:uncharacterized protein (TIGR02145 family)
VWGKNKREGESNMKRTIAMLVLLYAAAFAQQKGTFTDARDKKKYKTVKIGEQVWMAENLNYNASGSKCYAEGVKGVSANSIAKNCATYGRLYDWETAMGGSASSNANPSGVQGVCPAGWHLPSDAEWDALMTAVGSPSKAGTKLKAASGWNSRNSNGNGTDAFGFSALPGGYFSSIEDFEDIGSSGYWWSSTEVKASRAYFRNMTCIDDNVFRSNPGQSKSYFYSVRCVQDSP